MSSYAPTRQTPSMIPGVVDGTMGLSRDAEGNVSLHVSIRDSGDYVELILTEEHVRELGAQLVAGRPDDAFLAPCSVGVRLASPFRA
ncbi:MULTISPECIES: hypothetical protein [unclassified Streptomyces]|uniref:hypothetical protein n=1 Tax=unclassified Streptomyces TaxID=2593676 RepID=UPI002259381A|nr:MULTISPECIES: hypothetical protein [unclassified Streptomyces]MCX4527041.1 hypothetical protein [Streptomyces sp. NBC_01551]MCX4542399.1 hypothetical protein [Streptomyces sp. NBC_01565]